MSDQDLHVAADKNKADLDHNVATHVARGDETTPPPRVDAFAARKAMFKKSDALRGGIDTSGDGNVSPELVQAMLDEAAGGAPGQGAPSASPAASVADPLQATGEYVSIPIEGGASLSVAKRDVEREGGVQNYLRRRQLDADQAQVERDRAETARLRREMIESGRQSETLRTRSASQDDSAQGNGQPPLQNRQGSSESGATLDEKAARLAGMIYGGDEGDAKSAILEILTQQAQGRGNLSEAEILRIVEARTAPARPANPPPATVSSVDIINQMVNAMAQREYADICADPVAQPAAYAKFVQMCNLPANRDRRAVDVARDACEWARSTFGKGPRAHIVEAKRGLPPSNTASGVATISEVEEEALTPSQVVQQMADRRNFGKRQ